MIEIAIFCRNEAPRIGSALAVARSQAQTVPESQLPLRVHVLENGSDDGTADVARECGDSMEEPGCFEVVVHAGLPPGKTGAWNYFVERATADVVGFMDADVGLSPRAVASLLRLLQDDEGLDLAAAVPALPPDFEPVSFWQSVFSVPYTALRPAPSVTGHLYLARRDRLSPLPTDTINEDLVLSIRHAGRYVVSEQAVAYAIPPSRLSEFLHQRSRIRRSDAMEQQRLGVDLQGHRRKRPGDALTYLRAAGPVKLTAFLAAAALGKALSWSPSRGAGWTPRAGRA